MKYLRNQFTVLVKVSGLGVLASDVHVGALGDQLDHTVQADFLDTLHSPIDLQEYHFLKIFVVFDGLEAAGDELVVVVLQVDHSDGSARVVNDAVGGGGTEAGI